MSYSIVQPDTSTASSSTGSLVIEVPVNSDTSLQSFQVVCVKSWREDGGDCVVWLSCSSQPDLKLGEQLLRSQWSDKSTQSAMASIWPPLTLISNTSTSASTANAADSLPCVLDTVHFLPLGKFKLMGYIYS